ncbi:MAG: DNA replication and repair protein RecF [Patescibacteria group bacterium]
MEILSLTLVNFRNFTKKNLAFSELTVIIGPNGSGKSNLLEAISLLAGVRSTRVETDLDLVKFGKSEAKIESKVESSSFAKASEDKQSEKKMLTINFQVIDELYVKKAYFVDSIKKRLVDFGQFLFVVVFEPVDLDLVIGSPTLRRHFLDNVLATTDRAYWRSINAFNKIIIRRNKVLQRIKERKSAPVELDFWDERLLEHGKYISQKRQAFFEFLSLPVENDFFSGLSWQLKQSLIDKEKLFRNRERDIAAGMTLSGPQRDDFRFLFNGRDLEYFGARGEQRTAVLALKIAELEYYTVKKGQRPILALDDIFSELDEEHREAVLSVIGKQQTIITSADPDSVPKKILKKTKVIELN